MYRDFRVFKVFKKPPLPDILYKFFPMDDYSLKSLEKNSIWFNPIYYLKDKNDSSSIPTQRFIIERVDKDGVPVLNDPKNANVNVDRSKIKGAVIDFLEFNDQFKKWLEKFTKAASISCFTREINDWMWKEYASNYSGFILEFDFKRDHFFKYIYEVRYKQEPHIADNLIEVVQGYLYKHTDYKDENEHRMITKNKGYVNYNPKSLRSITIGTHCSQDYKNRLLFVLRSPKFKHVNITIL